MNIVLDTGCSRTLVHRKIVLSQKMIPDNTVRSWRHCTLPVDVEIWGKTFAVEATVSDTLPASGPRTD